MSTTYTVTNTFAADTTAVASEVNQNFTDVLTALNAFDASNLASSTVPLARIAGLLTSNFAANVIDTDDTLAADSDTRIASQQAGKAYTDNHKATSASAATVFNTTLTAANTFQDLDLSGTVGSNLALVQLEITSNSGSAPYAAKPKGQGSATFLDHIHTSGFATGGSSFHPQNAGKYGYITLFTDSNGVIQHGCTNNTTTHTVKVIGYIT